MSGFAAEFDMAVNRQFRAWDFEKATEAHQQHSPSDSTNSTSFDEDRIRIAPNNISHLNSIFKKRNQAVLNEAYMSSEEALSPAEQSHTDIEADDSETEFAEAAMASTLKQGITAIAIAVYIVSAGKPKVVDIPVPSLTSSPSIGSESDMEMKRGYSTDSYNPPKPTIRPRNPSRPQVRTHYANTYNPRAPMSTPRTADSATASILHDYSSSKDSSSLSRSHTTATHSTTYTSQTSQLETYQPFYASQPNSNASTPAFLNQDPFDDSTYNPRTNTRANHSRLRNLSQKIGRMASINNSARPNPRKDQQSPTAVSSPAPASTVVSKPKPRMIARGANERAPTIEIPPCPYDYLDDDKSMYGGDPMRRKSFAAFH